MFVLTQMRDRKIILSPYLDQELVATVYKSMGVPVNSETMGGEEDVGEEIDEEV